MHRTARRTQTGFSLIELLVVLGIIGIMAAVALPNFMSYMRNYQIRAAVQQVTGEIQTARNKAIVKNVNVGVIFVVRGTAAGPITQYQWAVEDNQVAPVANRNNPAGTTDFLVASTAQSGTVKQLPQGIVFGTNCPGGFTANGVGFRFNRLGSWCNPGAAGCPALSFATPPLSVFDQSAAGASICLSQPTTGLTRRITVAPGGRVLAPQ